MKNYSKPLLFILSIIFLVSLASSVFAYSNNPFASYTYTDVSDSVSYSEDLFGESRGFALNYKPSIPRTNPSIGCSYSVWTPEFRKCGISPYQGRHYERYYRYNNGNDYNNNYDKDKALKEAFETHQQNSRQQYQLESQKSKQEYQLELKKIEATNRRQYGGYGSGYSN